MKIPASDRERARATRYTFLIHLRPVRVPAATLRWTHTFGLGGSSLVLVALLAVTGILMMLAYQPVPNVAYDSTLGLQNSIAFGSLVRGMHYWSANLLLFLVGLHTARVLFTGGHGGTRRFTWVLGAFLLFGVLVSSFTGYLLPWDQRSYWAITICASMLDYLPWVGSSLQHILLGGEQVGPNTLILFYTLHTSVVPVLLVFLMGWHFWRVRRSGGVIEPPTSGNGADDKVTFLPHLFLREVAQGLALVAVVLLLAALLGAPLGERANPGLSPNPAKAPWYFMGFQELLIHFHPLFAVFLLPLIAAIGFTLLPYLTPEHQPGGTWFLSATGRRTALTAAVLALVITPLLVMLDAGLGRAADNWLMAGLLPTLGLAAFVWGFAALLRRRLGASGDETAQAAVTLLVVAFIVMTAIGVWFRGEGMALVWPGG